MAIIPHSIKGNKLADKLPEIYSRREFVYRNYRGESAVVVGHPEVGDGILINKDVIEKVTGALAHTIQKDIIEARVRDGIEGIVGICTLKGANNFFNDLTAKIDTSLIIGYEFFRGKGWEKDQPLDNYTVLLDIPEEKIRGKHLLIVEDIVDRGTSLYGMVMHLAKKSPASIKTVTLLDKPDGRNLDGAIQGIKANYTGLIIDNLYVFGYGLDSNGMYRNLSDIFVKLINDKPT